MYLSRTRYESVLTGSPAPGLHTVEQQRFDPGTLGDSRSTPQHATWVNNPDPAPRGGTASE